MLKVPLIKVTQKATSFTNSDQFWITDCRIFTKSILQKYRRAIVGVVFFHFFVSGYFLASRNVFNNYNNSSTKSCMYV